MHKYALCFLYVCLFTTLTSCKWEESEKKSILILAVDHLPHSAIQCGEEEESTGIGFRILCRESVRFTHTFTTSTLNVPALASLLTAKYPAELDVHNNGSDYLRASFVTAAEVAQQNGYETAFFSSGGSVWRKSGLSQGFEHFDDNLELTMTHVNRSATQTVGNFLDWLKKEGKDRQFFSVLHFSDMEFDQKLENVNLAIQDLVNQLKRQNQWSKTHIILVGLNGMGSQLHITEVPPLNLYSENTQVALLIKSARPQRDEGKHWDVNKNVSLVDVGQTIFTWLGEKVQNQKLPTFSLVELLKDIQVEETLSRPILIESGWGSWRGISAIRFAIRWEQYHILIDQKVKFFNTLSDQQELVPIPIAELANTNVLKSIDEVQKEFKISNWKLTDLQKMSWYEIANEYFSNQSPNLDELARECDRFHQPECYLWLIKAYIENEKWDLLCRLKNKSPIFLQTEVNWLCDNKINQSGAPHFLEPSCWINPKNPDCSSSLNQAFLSWARADANSESIYRDTLSRELQKKALLEKIQIKNYRNWLTWDTDLTPPIDTITNLIYQKSVNLDSAKRIWLKNKTNTQ